MLSAISVARQPLGEVDQAGLAGVIGIGLLRIGPDPVDRGDVDDLGRPLGGCCGLERPVQGLGQEERRLEVQVHHLVPAVLGEGVELGEPGGAGVVDQDVELGFVLRKGAGQGLAAFDGRDVLRQRDAARSELGGRCVAGGGLARRDVDLGAEGDEAGGDHLADAARAAGDERRAPGEGEEVGRSHGVSGFQLGDGATLAAFSPRASRSARFSPIIGG